MATETQNPIISSLRDGLTWSDLRLSSEEKPKAKAFCYKLTTGFNDVILRLLDRKSVV